MTNAEFRRLALGCVGATESAHMGHPDFRVENRIFATLGYPAAGWAVVKLTPAQQSRIVKKHPDACVPVKGAWGLKGSTNIRLDAADPETVRTLVEAAWRNVSSSKPRAPRRR